MGLDWFNKSSKHRTPSTDRRKADRHTTNILNCKVGEIVDISTTGMKIKCACKPPIKVGQVLEAKLESTSHRLPVTGQVMWIRRKGLKSFEVGIQFVNLKKSVIAAIESLGLFGFIDLEAAAAAKQKKYGKATTSNHETIRAAISLPDYYGILEINSNSTPDEIQLAFRNLARKYHPDVAKTQDAAKKFIEISQAYDILRDVETRQSYDLRRTG